MIEHVRSAINYGILFSKLRPLLLNHSPALTLLKVVNSMKEIEITQPRTLQRVDDQRTEGIGSWLAILLTMDWQCR